MLMNYLSDLSKRHAEKLLCPVTGAHCFSSVPVISAKMWAKVNTFDVQRLLSSRPDQGTSSQTWEAELKFFFAKYELQSMPLTEMIDGPGRPAHQDGQHLDRSSVHANLNGLYGLKPAQEEGAGDYEHWSGS